MRRRLAHGEPLLRQGEIGPGAGLAAHAPGHPAGEVIGREPGAGVHYIQHLAYAYAVMLDDGAYALGHGARDLPVSGQGHAHVVDADIHQAVYVMPQRVAEVGPGGDVGRDIEQHVVAQEHDLAGLVIEAYVPGGVARGLYYLELVSAVGEHVPVGHIGELDGLVLRVLHAG